MSDDSEKIDAALAEYQSAIGTVESPGTAIRASLKRRDAAYLIAAPGRD